jgi:hypothetical protein
MVNRGSGPRKEEKAMLVDRSGRVWLVACQPQPYNLRDLLKDLSLVLGIVLAIRALGQ